MLTFHDRENNRKVTLWLSKVALIGSSCSLATWVKINSTARVCLSRLDWYTLKRHDGGYRLPKTRWNKPIVLNPLLCWLYMLSSFPYPLKTCTALISTGSGTVLSVPSHGVLEVQLVFSRWQHDRRAVSFQVTDFLELCCPTGWAPVTHDYWPLWNVTSLNWHGLSV